MLEKEELSFLLHSDVHDKVKGRASAETYSVALLLP